MPYRMERVGSRFRVVNIATGEVHARSTSRARAQAQLRLLRAIEHNPKFKPRR